MSDALRCDSCLYRAPGGRPIGDVKKCLALHCLRYHLHYTDEIECADCRQRCTERRTLWHHQWRHHLHVDNADLLYCDQCERTFKSRTYLRRHVISAHLTSNNDVGAAFACALCLYTTSLKKYMVCHQQTCHDEGRRLDCAECKSTYQSADALRKHVGRLHKKVRFICDECDKPCIEKTNLRYHLTDKRTLLHEQNRKCQKTAEKNSTKREI